MADIVARYPWRLTFLHDRDSAGETGSTSALTLIPVEECPGVLPHNLEESVMFSTGHYFWVPAPDHYVKVSKKIGKQKEPYTFNSSEREVRGAKVAASNVSRAQLGTSIHEVWIKDIIKHAE